MRDAKAAWLLVGISALAIALAFLVRYSSNVISHQPRETAPVPPQAVSQGLRLDALPSKP